MEASLPYHEPSITTIVILTGFLLLLNVINYGLDKLVYCGLIGQVFLGIAWGTPGAKWLSREIEDAVMQLGYLGLILLVYEGGLATSFRSLKANFGRSSGVAATGIALPIGLSYVLQSMLGATPLQAFAAGAALCSTSLGTTFTILGTSGLSSTRLGVVLTSAAMMDDVVGLIMVQVVSNLGDGAFNAVTVVRPVLVSLGLAVLVPILCRFLVRPITLKLNAMREANPQSKLDKCLRKKHTAFVIHSVLLFALVVGGTFAGTSSLLAAYIVGASISWWDAELPHVALSAKPTTTQSEQGVVSQGQESTETPVPAGDQASLNGKEEVDSSTSGIEIYDHYYKSVVENILKPFFFASIGFSVPITKMFAGPIVWRGVIYTVLMLISKLMCGIWLVPLGKPLRSFQLLTKKLASQSSKKSTALVPGAQCTDTGSTSAEGNKTTAETAAENLQMNELSETQRTSPVVRNSAPQPEMPVSLYPACIIACGMVARGEIGFLIAALAESKGILGGGLDGQPSELFLVVTWAISLCTIIGPICIGLLVSRVKKLERGKNERGAGSRNVLGSWGVA